MAKKKKQESNELIPAAAAKVLPISIEQEMRSSYIDYAMSVIVGRALPDVRDGLKPVHRRILFAMEELGLPPNRAHKKSARVVGEVLGKYHPHGDLAVYEALVRMAQDFSLRYPLVDGQGNFGSVDGDSAAAMRYTEVRLTPIAVEILQDLDKETVPFGPNFDESLQEPLVMPSKFPNLIVNGSSGIAVGMATNMAPHNLTQVVDGITAVIENPDITIEELSKIVTGPDFPTGGLICGKQGIKDAYATGRGLITLRARVHVEELKAGKESLIVTEIPYQVNKSQLIQEIAELVRDKKIQGISDLRDESDREGMRIYIELKRDANRDIVLNQLFKHTALQTTFGINMLALVDGEPKLLSLKDLLAQYVIHRENIITKRAQYELKKAEEQAHILEGLRIAVANIDAIVKLIRGSESTEAARDGLMKKFKLSQIQAQAILDMRLARLTQLERHKIEEEYKQLQKLIGELKALLASRKKILALIEEELADLKKRFGDERRTEITKPVEGIEVEDLIPDVEVAVPITRDGFIKRMPIGAFRSQLRGGRGVTGMVTREADVLDKIIVGSTHSFLLFFTSKGKVYRVKIYEIPEASRAGKGQSVATLLELAKDEVVTAAIPVRAVEKNQFLVMATKHGIVKKTPLEEFENIRRSGIIAINLKDNDELGWVQVTEGKQDIILGTKQGIAIRFSEDDARPMGRAAAGVRGINLEKGDAVISMDIIDKEGDLLIISKQGFGKRVSTKEFRGQRRGGKGLRAIKMRKGDEVARLQLITGQDEILLITASGTLSRQKAGGISQQSRYASGVRVQRIDAKDAVVDFARVVNEETDIETAVGEDVAEAVEPTKIKVEVVPHKRKRKAKTAAS